MDSCEECGHVVLDLEMCPGCGLDLCTNCFDWHECGNGCEAADEEEE